MRNMVILCVSVFAFIIAAGYSMAWYFQSRELKSFVEEGIKSLNGKAPYITYDALETSGYPFSLRATLINPRFKGRMDEFLLSVLPVKPQQPLQPWEEEASMTGSLTLGVNIFANEYTLQSSGHSVNTSTLGGTTYQLATQSNGDATCTLRLDGHSGIFGTLWDFYSIAERKPEDFIRDLRLLDCNGAGFQVVDRTSNEVLMRDGPVRFFISSDKGSAGSQSRQVRLYIKSTDSEVTAKGDPLVSAYMNALFPGVSAAPLTSAYGKRNAELDFNYDGPIAFEQELKATPLNLHLNTFSLSNSLYQSKGSVHFINGASPKGRSTKLTFGFESSYDAQYDAMLHETVRGFILQLYSPFVPQPAEMQPLIRKYNADSLYQVVMPAIPSMNSLGKLTQSLDFAYEGAEDLSAGDITFTNLNLSAAPYGITGRGSIKLTAGQPLPAANVLLACNNCARLVDDASNYIMRLDHTLNALSENPGQVSLLAPQQTDGLKAFLAALAKPAEAGGNAIDYDYNLISDGASSVTVNGKKMDEVMAIYNQTLAQQPQLPVPQLMP